MDKILVIVVTYNAMKWIDRCLGSLQKTSVASDVYVVDNGSTDETISFIKSNYPQVLLFVSNINLGFGQANNLGLQYAVDNGYDYIYLLNQDAWVMHDTFEKLIFVNKKYPKYGILSPIQLTASMDKFDKNFGDICQRPERKCDLLENLYFKNSCVSDISCVMAAHWLISRDCLLKVGGFSPAFPHYCEDDNYAERAIYKGFRIGIAIDAQAVHDREYRKVSNSFKMYKANINRIRYFSNINGFSSLYWFKVLKSTICMVINYKSLHPIIDLVFLIKNKAKIEKYRKMSFEDGAFLKI